MKINKKAIIALTALLAAANVMPTAAAVVRKDNYTNTLSGNAIVGTVVPGTEQESNGKRFEAPGWLWIEGNCYYFSNKTLHNDVTPNYSGSILFKSGTTPDGYTVDDQGRWTVDGVVQTNTYGQEKLGMGEQYVGKSEDEIWNLMKGKLKEIWMDQYVGSNIEDGYFETSKTFLQGSIDANGNSEYKLMRRPSVEGNPFLHLSVPTFWNDWAKVNTIYASIDLAGDATKPETTEKTIKTVLGDAAGQVVFDAYRNSAKNNIEQVSLPNYDENGYLQDTGIPVMTSAYIKESDINMTITTDYGRQAKIVGADIYIY